MMKKMGLFKNLSALALVGVMSVSMLMTVNVAKAAGEDVEINETNFPDEIFRNYIESNFDEDEDGYLSQQEIEKIESIDVQYAKQYHGGTLRSIKGIEYFTNLKVLKVGMNELTEIDVSRNVNLEDLAFILTK
ncbi:MAG: hypothetical protein IJO70_05810 [Lachnospiraceae bacterium]|nr:hypothetical protein [Lachnospiraceae bacterium]